MLGKKSWNVYNADNIAKVKRDEAVAAAREESKEQQMQEADAERRIQILRGIQVEAPQAPVEEDGSDRRRARDEPGRERKRRRVAGEDDTDRDIRFAQEDNVLVPAKAEMRMTSKNSNNAPLVDGKGHINLFPVEGSKHHAPKNAEVEAEKAKKQKEYEDQYTMRFSNAAGFKQAVGQTPWYHKIGTHADGDAKVETPSKDVWGNEDPRRKERTKMRIAADDPLAAIKKGVAGVRDVEKQRLKWREEKSRETRELEEEDRRRRKRRKQHEDDLEGFRLDEPANAGGRRHRHHRPEEEKRRHSHGDRSRGHNVDVHHSRRQRHRSPQGWEAGASGRYSNQFAHV